MHKQSLQYDAIIVGAGPAGVSCAAWLARLGFKPILVDAADAVGGLCRTNPFMDDWNASLPGANGLQVAKNLALSIKQSNVTHRLSWPVQTVEKVSFGESCTGFLAVGPNKEALSGRFLVLAPGVKARGLTTGAEPLSNAVAQEPWPGVLVGPGQHVANHNFTGERVAVLGGGDNAFENALFALEKGAQSVQVYARTVRAQQQFVQRLTFDDVTVGDYSVEPERRTVDGQAYDVLLIMYGWVPNTDFVADLKLKRTGRGFISIDFETGQTSHEGVFAVGEVTSRQHPCVVTALADGVTAAKAIQARLESDA